MHPAAEKVINEVIEKEGEAYTDHPSDLGGPTKWGITQRALSVYLHRQASKDEVRNLSRETAKAIYYENYVHRPGFETFLTLSPVLAAKIIDVGVNVGTARVSEWIQRALNKFNMRQKLYADIAVDGDVGPQTMNAYTQLIQARGKANAEEVMFKAINVSQGAHYLSISDSREANEDFTYGWFKNRVD